MSACLCGSALLHCTCFDCMRRTMPHYIQAWHNALLGFPRPMCPLLRYHHSLHPVPPPVPHCSPPLCHTRRARTPMAPAYVWLVARPFSRLLHTQATSAPHPGEARSRLCARRRRAGNCGRRRWRGRAGSRGCGSRLLCRGALLDGVGHVGRLAPAHGGGAGTRAHAVAMGRGRLQAAAPSGVVTGGAVVVNLIPRAACRPRPRMSRTACIASQLGRISTSHSPGAAARGV